MIWGTAPGRAATGELTFSPAGLPVVGPLVRAHDAAGPTADRPGPRRAGPRRRSDPLDRRAARILAEADETAAGLFFVPPPGPARSLPVAPDAYLVVHVRVAPTGFEVAGRPLPPAALARAIRCLPTWRHRPVVVIPVDPPPPARRPPGLSPSSLSPLSLPSSGPSSSGPSSSGPSSSGPSSSGPSSSGPSSSGPSSSGLSSSGLSPAEPSTGRTPRRTGPSPFFAQMMAEFAFTLGAFVITPSAGVYLGRQVLVTGGSFLRWPPVPDGGGHEPFEPFGRVLPARPGRA